MKHKHHIVPKHKGGTDESHNLIEVSVKEHALWHWCEWQLWKEVYDRIAWLSLSGQINVSDAKKLAQLEGAKKGGTISSQKRKENKNTIGDWNKRTGHVRTIATKESCSKGGSVAGTTLVESGRFDEIRKLGSSVGGRASIKLLNNKKVMCLECGMISTPSGIGNHQKSNNHKGKEEIN